MAEIMDRLSILMTELHGQSGSRGQLEGRLEAVEGSQREHLSLLNTAVNTWNAQPQNDRSQSEN
jgi:hypothetical protein